MESKNEVVLDRLGEDEEKLETIRNESSPSKKEVGKIEDEEAEDNVDEDGDDEDMIDLLAQDISQTQTQTQIQSQTLTQNEQKNTLEDGNKNVSRDNNSLKFESNLSDSNSLEKIRLPKRPKSSYFHFANTCRAEIQEENKGKGVAAVAKIIGERWKNLSLLEKEKYDKMAKREKEDYNKEIRRLQELGVDIQQLRKKESGKEGPEGLPFAKIRNLIRKDPEVKVVSKDAATAITKATELFLKYMAKSSLNVARAGGNKNCKTINKMCVHRSIHEGPDQLDFLVHDFEKPSVLAAAEKNNVKIQEAAISANPITNFFKA